MFKTSVGETPCERRFGEPFTGPVVPLGAMVECHPISAKDQSRLHQFGQEVLPGTFLGNALIAGEFLVASRSWTFWTRQEIRARRLNATEVLTPQRGDS